MGNLFTSRATLEARKEFLEAQRQAELAIANKHSQAAKDAAGYCRDCMGRGWKTIKLNDCEACKGYGYEWYSRKMCDKCKNKDTKAINPCPTCEGRQFTHY